MQAIKHTLIGMLLAIFYFVLAQIGLLFAISPGNVTPVWLPSGLIIFFLLVYGYRYWPGVFLGAFSGNVYAYIDTSSLQTILLGVSSGLFNGLGDTLCAIFAVYMINKRFRAYELFDDSTNILYFTLYAAGIASLISAIFGTTGLLLCGFIKTADIITVCTTWFIGDAIGVLLVCPFLLSIRDWASWQWLKSNQTVELFAYLCLFSFTLINGLKIYPFSFHVPSMMILPVMMWAVLRFPKHITLLSLAIVSATATIITSKQGGPFFATDVNTSLIQLQLFIFIVSLTSYLLISYINYQKNMTRRLSSAKKQLHYLAHHDELTGLANRYLFKKTVNRILENNQKRQLQSVMFFLDIDNFKTVNDSLGHSTGDIILQKASIRLREVIRTNDIICRHGGDEFIIFIPEVSGYEQINLAASRLINSLERPFYIDSNLPIYISVSIGVAVAPHDGNRHEHLIKNADTAMYRAKAKGRNQFCYFDQSQNKAAARALTINNHLHSAIENNEIYVVYQPIFSATKHQLLGAEALVRWHSEELGNVPPDEFISIAEQNSKITDIFNIVYEDSLKQLKAWNELSSQPLFVSVNVSPKQLVQGNLNDTINGGIKKHQISPSQIQLEITESMMLHNKDKMHALLSGFSRQGFRIALDDFGTGYSSLSYLRQYPINTIKIDKTFMDDLSSGSKRSMTFIQAIILIARGLGISVVAEGVETQNVLDIFEGEGGDMVQGYYFSKPLLASDFLSLLSKPTVKE